MNAKPLVWVVGDAMLDVTVDAKEFRPSQEDPDVQVLSCAAGTVTRAAGGAANPSVSGRFSEDRTPCDCATWRCQAS